MIVFADSPYKRFVPVRFCVVDEVADEPHKITVLGHLGPFIDARGQRLLTGRWAERTGENRPGLRFLFTDDDPGVLAPTTPDGHDEAWRAVIDELGTNPYFGKLTAARVLRVRGARGVERDRDEPVDVGETLTVDIELRTPARRSTRWNLRSTPTPAGRPSWSTRHRCRPRAWPRSSSDR